MVLAAALVVAGAVRAQEGYVQQPGEEGGQQQQVDPPSQVARISLAVGNVSVEPASVDQFSVAETNYPLTTGDRIYADAGANAELETDALAVRLGQTTDLTVTAMTDTLAQFGLAQGSVHLRSFSLEPNATVELDTPNVAVTVLQPGDVRVDVDPNSDTTTVTVVSGQVQVDGNGLQQTLQQGQRVRLSGSDPVATQWLYLGPQDGLDRFSMERDNLYESSVAGESQYVDQDTIGAADLSGNGDWETDADEGPVWYPSAVAADWAPYRCGHWAWVAPWGWTWVECESWGFAPFHYGRWIHHGRRWGWIPGPPRAHPVYSPALVVFVGGAGVTAWFPLGPREPYEPWYHTSAVYVNRVNVTNIYNRNPMEVRAIYNERTLAPAYAAEGDRGYANRQIATVAVPQASFAAGRRVSQVEVHVSAEELASAPVLAHPLVTPQRSMVVQAPARAVPVRAARPELATRTEVAEPRQGESRPEQENGVTRPAPTQQVPAQQAPVERQQPHNNVMPAAPIRPQPTQAPVQEPNPARGEQPAEQPRQMPVQQPNPGRGVETMAPAQQPVAPARPLFNKAVPPAPRPSFDEQQKAMESTDPGRPLSPQQLENLRQRQPVGPPQQQERPHAAPAPRPAPAPRAAPASAPKAAPHK
jgi:hypothetical protein